MVARDPTEVLIRAARASDAAEVAAIYNHFVTHTTVTFEEEAVAISEISRRIEEVEAVPLPWLVAQQMGKVVGYAYATKWRARPAYRFSAEVTVYVALELAGRTLGSTLYAALLSTLQAKNIHSAMGCIALPNDASVALHEKFGFKKVAHFAEAGFKFNRWIDVGYWQRLL